MGLTLRTEQTVSDLSLEMVRAFAWPQPHHAHGELDAGEASFLRVICAETLAHRLNVRRGLREHGPGSAQTVPGHDLVPDHILFEFARPTIEVEPGTLSGVELAMGSLYFSDICGELLAYRLLAGAEAGS